MKKVLFVVVLAFFSFNSFSQGSKVKPEYNFAGSLKFTTTSTSKGKAMTSTSLWYFPVGNEMIFGTEMLMGDPKGRNVKGIMDYANKTMIMFMDEQKMIMGLPFDMEKTMKEMQNDPKNKITPPKKTGRSKKVMGYACEEWVSDGTDYLSSMWISDKLPIVSTNFYKIMAQQLYKSTGTPMPADMRGIPLEIDTHMKKTGDKYVMICTEISNKPTKFSTAGYKIMN